jgi:RNA polymerase sigma factor (sigma-70 family)
MMNARKEFDRVFNLYFKSVYAYFSVCFSPGAAEDCAQQVFLNVWKGLAAPGGFTPDNWKAWVFRLAVNVKNDCLRRKYAACEETLTGEEILSGSAEDDLTERVAVEQAFNRLDAAVRELLLLKSNGFTSAEIGGLFNISASAARSRLAAARLRFQESLLESGVVVNG